MGGAVLYSRQASDDCPDYADCTCENWGLECDVTDYTWYDCSDESIAGPDGCGAASASASGSIARTSTGAPISSVAPTSSVPPTTAGPSTTAQQSFTTGIGGVTIQPGDCPNDGVRQNAPYCPTTTAATSFSCGAGSNIGAATFTPATWCGCNDGNTYPTMTSASDACAYTAAPAGSLIIHPSAVPVPSTTSIPPAPSTTQAPTSTAFDSTKTTLSCGASFGDASAVATAVPRAQTNNILKSIAEFCTPQNPSTLTLIKGKPAYHSYPIADSDPAASYQLAFWWDDRPECANAPAPSIVASVPKGPSYWCNQYFDQITNGCDAGDGQDKYGGTLSVDCAVYGWIAYIEPDEGDAGLEFGGAKR